MHSTDTRLSPRAEPSWPCGGRGAEAARHGQCYGPYNRIKVSPLSLGGAQEQLKVMSFFPMTL